jgi:DNA (cytosine-5)-methyltransferase 1
MERYRTFFPSPALSHLTTEHGAVWWVLQQRPYGHMDTTKAITHLGLCAGYGGIELGLQRAIPDLRTVALCEIEAFAVANLVAKMEAGLMDPAPIWPNLKTFPWAAFRDRVDILTGGYPCQPFSAAGQRKGKQDPRHLWPWIADGIRLLRPRICFFENVEGHISLGLSDVIEDLAGMGYRTTWGIFSASEVGAPHQRKRVFILAVSSGFRGASGLSGSVPRHEKQPREPDNGGDQGVADTECGGLAAGRNDAGQSQGSKSKYCSAWPSRPGEQQYGWEPPRVVGDTSCEQNRGLQQPGIQADAASAGPELGDTGCERQEERQVEAGGSEQSDEVRDVADSGFIGSDRRSDGSSRWSRESGEAGVNATGSGSQGDGMRQAQPPLGRDIDGSSGRLDYAELCVSCDNRTDELRLLGNGVVPHTAELAFRVLIQELANE